MCLQTEMAGSDDTRIILEALQAGRMSAKERQTAVERSIREEARRLRTGGAAGEPLCWCIVCFFNVDLCLHAQLHWDLNKLCLCVASYISTWKLCPK